MQYFLDTSSWIKRYCGEEGFERIDSIIQDNEVIIYDLEITELISNLYRIYNEKYILKEELEFILSIVFKDIAQFKIIKHSDKHIFDFIKICEKSRQTAIDGMIILLAKEIKDIIIVTSDSKLLKGAELENIGTEYI